MVLRWVVLLDLFLLIYLWLTWRRSICLIEPVPFKPRFYHRYVKDTFALFESEEYSIKLLGYINTLHQNIKFTQEKAENTLAFLDINMKRTCKVFKTSVNHLS